MRSAAVIAMSLALAVRAAEAEALSAGEMAAGKKLANAKCLACHKWRDPAGYSESQWGYWMEKMQHKARLSDENYRKLLRYFAALRTQSSLQARANP